jgi:DNA-binding transcriptional LysR family regulator
LEINQIEAFVMVAQSGGFSRAGILLHLSQPAVSRRITLLEQALGTLLFERIHNGIVLTPAGQAFLPYAQRVLAEIRDGIDAVKQVDQGTEGTITLAIVGTLASSGLTARLRQFRAAHPHIRLILRTARSREVSDMVRSGETQLGLRYFADADPKLVSQVIGHEEVVVACSTQSPLAALETISLDDLRGLPWVSFPLGQGSSGEPFAQLLMQLLETAGLQPDVLTIDSLTAQKRLIEADFGIGLLPISSIQEELAVGSLHILRLPALQAAIPIVLLFRQNAGLNKAAHALRDALIESDHPTP